MKLTREVKVQITKLFKSGKTVDQIILAAGDDFPRITATRVNEVVRKHLFDQADRLWSDAVKLVGKCEISGRTWNLEAHHLINRNNLRCRWDLDNGICLNNDLHSQAHADEGAFLYWLRSHKPEQWEWWGSHGSITKQVDNDELLQICKDLKYHIERQKYANSKHTEIGERQRVVPETDTI